MKKRPRPRLADSGWAHPYGNAPCDPLYAGGRDGDDSGSNSDGGDDDDGGTDDAKDGTGNDDKPKHAALFHASGKP